MNSLARPLALPADPTGRPLDPFLVRVQVLYQDKATGLRAKQVVDQLETDLDREVDLRTSWLRFDLLEAPLLYKAVEHATTATDIMLVSAHGQEELPEAVTLLVEAWLDKGSGAPPAVVLLLDPSARERRTAPLMRLEQLARAKGVNLFAPVPARQSRANDLSIEAIRSRAETDLRWASRTHESLPRRHWGLNE
jgi:hypothetical protein